MRFEPRCRTQYPRPVPRTPATSTAPFARRGTYVPLDAIRLPQGPAHACVTCRGPADLVGDRIGGALPLPLAVALILAVPLSFTLVLPLLWRLGGAGDLYEVMAQGERPLLWAAVPLWLPATLVPLALAITLGRSEWRIFLGSCAPCRHRNMRRAQLTWASLLALAVALGGLWHWLAVDVALYEVQWGLLFLPWALAASVALGHSERTGLRAVRVSATALRVTGAPHLAEVFAVDHPAALVDAPTSRLAPRPRALALWLVPLTLALLLPNVPSPRLGGGACAYGSYPLRFRSGVARVTAQRASEQLHSVAMRVHSAARPVR